MQEASRRKLKAVSVLVIYSVPESLLVACCIQDSSNEDIYNTTDLLLAAGDQEDS